MLIIIDAKLPEEVINRLRQFGEIFCLESYDIVYDSISGHPDIFMCQMHDLVILAPNSPLDLIQTLKKHRIPFLKAKEKLGNKYPETVMYNAVSTAGFIIHKKNYSASCILKQKANKKFISVSQAYTRCNLLALADESFITSDRGIEKTLLDENMEVHYFSSIDVMLNGQEHGFLPGALGILDNTVFVLGSLKHYSEGKRLKELLESKNLQLEELYNGALIDGGGIFFLEN